MNKLTDKVKEAIWYYISIPGDVLPINDSGWMAIDVKTRRQAGEFILNHEEEVKELTRTAHSTRDEVMEAYI